MDDLSQDLLVALKKPSATLDSKLNLFTSVKSHIKHQRIPESAQATTIECIRLAIASQTTPALVTTGFSALGHLIKRLTLQDQAHAVFNPRTQIIPTLLDRLGDPKESYRAAALQSLCDLYPARPMDVEKAVKEGAIQGSNARAKEGGMQWVTTMHSERSLQFKAFVPLFIECLSHADGGVRDTAKNNLVVLFRDSPDRAKADLKRQLIAQDVRKSIATYILNSLHLAVPPELSAASATSSMPRAETPKPEGGSSDSTAEPVLPPSAETAHIEPLYVDTQRQLEDMFRDMGACFEGRESEGNWMARDNAVIRIRRLLKGNAPSDFLTVLVGCLKHLLDGILKVFNSLRTTMSTNGSQVLQEMARTLGPSIDSMVEILLQNAIKMCSATKNIAAQNGNTTVDIIVSRVSYNARLMQHIWQSTQDKNVQPRIFAAGWLKTILKKHAQNKSHFEHTGGLELTEKSIKKGLNDSNPKVRESMRSTFWTYAQMWPEKGEHLKSELDAKSKQLLEKDPSNPDADKAVFTSSVGPSSTSNPRAAASNARAALKETIAAQKKASLAARKFPDRPSSAMANLSPMKQSTTATARAPAPMAGIANPKASTSAAAQSTGRPGGGLPSSVSQNSLMSGPVRRPKRPEMPRPATADPYANRRLLQTETPPPRSPANSPAKTSTKSAFGTSVGHVKHNSTTSMRPGTADSGMSSKTTSPRTSPAKVRPKTVNGPDTSFVHQNGPEHEPKTGSPSREENFTMVLPHGFGPYQAPFNSQRTRHESDRPASKHSALPIMAEEDNFTMVMPAESVISNTHGTSRRDERHPDTSDHSSHQVLEANGADEVMVYEDPSDTPNNGTNGATVDKSVLEELPINEHSHDLSNGGTYEGEDPRSNDGRSISPSKRGSAKTTEEPIQDRAEVLKNRRLLSSGVERLRARTLDSHGFRRLQELVKNSSRDPEVRLAGLLRSLADYAEAPNETLKVNASKAASLKSQALTTIRAIIVAHRRDEEARSELVATLCSILRSRAMTDGAAHLVSDLEKTAFEIVKYAGNRSGACIDAVTSLLAHDQDADAQGHCGKTTMALSMLAKLLATMQARNIETSKQQREGLGRLAVKYLDDTSSDIRKADTDLCLELHAAHGKEGKEEFWGSLHGAREAQLNLVAYYLARRGEAQEAR